jgi:hypothetical protein
MNVVSLDMENLIGKTFRNEYDIPYRVVQILGPDKVRCVTNYPNGGPSIERFYHPAHVKGMIASREQAPNLSVSEFTRRNGLETSFRRDS